MSGRLVLCGVAALSLAGCGARAGAPEAPPDAAPRGSDARYGIELSLPPGWHGRIRRGAVHAASFPLPPERSGWTRRAAAGLAADDVLVSLFESDPAADSPPLELGAYEQLTAPPRLDATDFEASDGLTDDSAASGHGFARRLFRLSGRYFVLFVESGERPPPDAALRGLHELLARLRVQPGDFYPGSVEPARFTPRAGWHAGTSGAAERRADGEWTTSWAATIPYADEWNALPPRRTLERLPGDGIAVWVSLVRDARFPPQPHGDDGFPARAPPFRLADFERRASWEGQVRDIPEHALWGTVRGQYRLDLRVWFGRPDLTPAMLAEAQAMLDGIVLPDWGSWETE